MFDVVNDCDDHSHEERCCRYNLIVDFQEMDWNWVIQPRNFAAYFCAGSCEYPYMSGSSHAHLVTLARDSGQQGGPCCTPVRMSPLSIMYVDEAGRLFQNTVIENMVAESCGCN